MDMTDVFENARLGLARGAVALVPGDPSWPAAFDRLAAVLRPALPDAVAGVEHVGSTAVPGLPAKPILDVAVGVRPGGDARAVGDALAGLGFLPRADPGGAGLNRVFGWEDRPRHRLANLHVVAHGGPEWCAYLAFRDRLRADPAALAAYAALKHSLATAHPADRASYVTGKDTFVADLLTG